MKVIDLSQTIDQEMSVFPGGKQPILKQVANIKDDYYIEHKIELTTHIGTHVDSPAHIVEGGSVLLDIDVNHYVGSAYVLDVSEKSEISSKDLELIPELDKVEFILFYTGLGEVFNSQEYYRDFPVLNQDGVDYLIKHGHALKGIGVDCFSIDKIDPVSIKNHIPILKHGLIIVENLCNIKSLIHQKFIFSALPLKASNIEGSPVRAVALIMED